jgi:ParB family transcriptional regulator, chromosome partitioning protein
VKIQIEHILPNPEQPRHEITPSSIAELAESIRRHGLINPISVEEAGDRYILIDGERRWRASKLAGLTEIEASVRPGMNGTGKTQRLVLAMVANIQRREMDPVDTAVSFRKMQELGYKIFEIAEIVGLHEASIYNYLAILKLSEPVQALFRSGKLSNNPESVRALGSIDDLDLQAQLAHTAADRGMSGEELNRMLRRLQLDKIQRRTPPAASSSAKPATQWEGHWNMIAQAGVTVTDERLEQAAKETCRTCPLYDMAGKVTCKECPAVTMLRKLV